MVTRRELILGATGATLASRYARLAAATPGDAPPNIVFILADDLGYADLGCFGRSDLRTPHIDSIATHGVRCVQAYANSAVCTATRVALITGRYQYRVRLGLEEPLVANADVGLPPEHPTLPSLLKDRGYHTMLIGKWHLGALPKFGPLQSGYDHFFGLRSGGMDYYSHVNPAGKPDLWDDNVPVERHGYATELFGDRAVEAIAAFANAQKPFLLSLHFTAPHWPWEGPGDEAESKRIAGTSLRDLDGGTMSTYRRMVEALDTQVGRVLGALSQHHLANTIVIFTSDNGGERFSNNWPFSGQKEELLEGGLRIPAIISWPEQLPQGQTSEQMMISMDWLPTLLAAARGAPHADFPSDGIDLLPMLRAGARPVQRRFFWRYKSNHQRALRDGDYKYLRILGHSYLFNVVEDPLERANLKEREPERFAHLVQLWKEWNSTMMPEVAESFGGAVDAASQADHIGAEPALLTPDEED